MQSVYTAYLPSGTGFKYVSGAITAATIAIVPEKGWATGKTPVRVYDIAVNGNKLGEALVLKTGSTTHSSSYLTVVVETTTGLASGHTDRVFSEGLLFPNGLYVSSGTGFVSAMISYMIEV